MHLHGFLMISMGYGAAAVGEREGLRKVGFEIFFETAFRAASGGIGAVGVVGIRARRGGGRGGEAGEGGGVWAVKGVR